MLKIDITLNRIVQGVFVAALSLPVGVINAACIAY
jgi:hypothetical protein